MKNEDYEDTLQEIHQHIGDVTAWEIDFLDSLDDQRNSGRRLTEKQLAKMEEIYERVTK